MTAPWTKDGGARAAFAEETVSGAQPLLLPLMNAGRQGPKKEHVEKASAMWAHRPPQSPLLHRPNPKSAGRPEVGSLAGWMPSPVLCLHLEPKVLPARAELAPSCPKPALLRLPVLLTAVDPALARPPRLEGQWAPAPHAPHGWVPDLTMSSFRIVKHPFPCLQDCSSLAFWTAAPRSRGRTPKPSFRSFPAPGAPTSRSGIRYHCCSKPWRRLSEKSARKLQRPSSSLRSRDALSRGYNMPPCSASPQPQRNGPSTAQAFPIPRTMISAWPPGASRRAKNGAGRGSGPVSAHLKPPEPFSFKAGARPGGVSVCGWGRGRRS